MSGTVRVPLLHQATEATAGQRIVQRGYEAVILHVHPIQLVTGMLARCFGCGHGSGLQQQTIGLHLSFPTYIDVDVATLAMTRITVICGNPLSLQQNGVQTGVGVEFTQAGHHLVQLTIGLLHAHGLCRPLQ